MVGTAGNITGSLFFNLLFGNRFTRIASLLNLIEHKNFVCTLYLFFFLGGVGGDVQVVMIFLSPI